MFLRFIQPCCTALLIGAAVFFMQGCSKEEEPAPVPVSLTTVAVVDVTRHTAQVQGEVRTGSDVTERGICWSTHEGATVDDHKLASGAGLGSFNLSLAGLAEGTQYFVRVYAVTPRGTEYGSEVSMDTQPANVYVSATIYFDGGNFSTDSPAYWKNGTFTQLPCGSSNSWATDVFVTDKETIYIAGTDGTSAAYWKNGTEVILSHTGLAFVVPYSIVVTKGNDIYLSGRAVTKFGVMGDAAYWKNGEFNLLWQNGSATSIGVSGNDIYTWGGTYADELGNAPYGHRVYKNGVDYILSDGVPGDGARFFIAGNGDVYIAGAKTGSNGKGIAKYWKNGTSVAVTDGTKSSGGVGMYVSVADVYMAGYEESASVGTTAKYWKNGTGVTLSAGNLPCMATQIISTGENVYVLGITTGEDDEYGHPILWKNGKIVPPFDGTQQDVYSPSLAIYDKE